MSVAKIAEISCSSAKSFEDAIELGIDRSRKEFENMRGAWVKNQSVVIKDAFVKEYRVDLKITYVSSS